MPSNDKINGRESRSADPEVGRGRGRSTHDKSISGANHGWETTTADANLIGAASDDDGGDKGMKMKKKSRPKRDADAGSWRRRGWHFRSRRRGRQRLVGGVVRREERRENNWPDGDNVTAQGDDDENRKTENKILRSG